MAASTFVLEDFFSLKELGTLTSDSVKSKTDKSFEVSLFCFELEDAVCFLILYSVLFSEGLVAWFCTG